MPDLRHESSVDALAPDPGAGAAGRRNAELDGLRGVAALIVVFYHFNYLWKACGQPPWVTATLERTPLALLVSGRASVLLFFVLSGFVLALPWVRGTPERYGVFAVKRVCRIWIPYLAALLLAVLGNAFFHGRFFGSPDMWQGPVDPGLVLRHVLLLGAYPIDVFNVAFLSLRIEMRLSLVFPFLCAALLALAPRRAVAAGVLGGIAVLFLSARTAPGSGFFTLVYAVLFMIGILLARHRREVGAAVDRLPKTARAAGLIGALALYLAPDVALGAGLPARWMGVTHLLTACGAAGVLAVALGENGVSAWLRSPVPLFLGRISYSLYLLHATVLYVLAYLFWGKLPTAAFFLLFVALSFLAAVAFYRWVDRPATDLGRRLAKRIAASRPCAKSESA